MTESIIIQSKVRELVKNVKPEFRLSEEFLTTLNLTIRDVVEDAVFRAEKNGRKTLQPQDL